MNLFENEKQNYGRFKDEHIKGRDSKVNKQASYFLQI
jgi:hypothetical protein